MDDDLYCANVALGIHGIVFTGLPAAKAALETLLQQGKTTT